MRDRLKLRRDGAQAWRLSKPATGIDVGGIDYVHAANGNHYRPWLIVDDQRSDVGEALPQLAMAARAIEAAVGTKPT